MKRFVLVSVAAVAMAGSVFALPAAAASNDAPTPMGHMEKMAEMRAFMLDSRLAGMKAALKLTAAQEKNWAPFEAAVRGAEKDRLEAMRKMHEAMGGAEKRPSPVERMDAMADRLAKASADVKAIAGAAKPLYDSLDDTQKSHFGWLLMSLRERRPQHGMMMMMHGGMGGPQGQ